MKVFYHRWRSALGNLHFIADEKALLSLAFDPNIAEFRSRFGACEENGENAIIARAKEELNEYFDGARMAFTVPIRLMGTDFQLRVWESLRRIPFGARRSYLDQAKELEFPSAVRAVASANGRNPICIIVPCHRIIRSDGSLGGYAGGLEMKSRLLQLESRSACLTQGGATITAVPSRRALIQGRNSALHQRRG